jgi:hypothetical protein
MKGEVLYKYSKSSFDGYTRCLSEQTSHALKRDTFLATVLDPTTNTTTLRESSQTLPQSYCLRCV